MERSSVRHEQQIKRSVWVERNRDKFKIDISSICAKRGINEAESLEMAEKLTQIAIDEMKLYYPAEYRLSEIMFKALTEETTPENGAEYVFDEIINIMKRYRFKLHKET